MSENWAYSENPAMFRSNPVLFILGALIPVVGWIGLGIWWLDKKGNRLSINDHELLLEKGILSKQRTQLSLSSVRTVRVTQSMFQRMFGIGDIDIFSAGDTPEISIKALPDPNRVRDLAGRKSPVA